LARPLSNARLAGSVTARGSRLTRKEPFTRQHDIASRTIEPAPSNDTPIYARNDKEQRDSQKCEQCPNREQEASDYDCHHQDPNNYFTRAKRKGTCNVVDNAVQYTPAGGRVDLRVFIEGGHAVVEVEDTGPGIPEKELEQVFEPFYRVPESGGSGSGLGLSIVKSIADKYGLNISLRNADPKAGLRFRCEISSFGT